MLVFKTCSTPLDPTGMNENKPDVSGKCGVIGPCNLQSTFHFFMAVIVSLDLIAICADADTRAADVEVPSWVSLFFFLCLVLYTIELPLSVCLFKKKALQKRGLDVVIILAGYLEIAVSFLGELDRQTFIFLWLARPLRILKLLGHVQFRGLSDLENIMLVCVKNLVWSFTLCFLIMTMWAIVVVELLYPCCLNAATDRELYCGPTSSVFNANLFLF